MAFAKKSTIKTIRAEVSLTLPVNNRYYKFTFCQEHDVSGVADLQKQVDETWKNVKGEINKQVKELCKTLDYDYKKLL